MPNPMTKRSWLRRGTRRPRSARRSGTKCFNVDAASCRLKRQDAASTIRLLAGSPNSIAGQGASSRGGAGGASLYKCVTVDAVSDRFTRSGDRVCVIRRLSEISAAPKTMTTGTPAIRKVLDRCKRSHEAARSGERSVRAGDWGRRSVSHFTLQPDRLRACPESLSMIPTGFALAPAAIHRIKPLARSAATGGGP